MKLRRKRRESEETPASAMSDIAFLLIVFFMVIAVFTVKEGFIIKTPEKDKEVKKASKDIVKVRITSDAFFISKEKVLKQDFEKTLKEKKQDKRIVILEIEGKAVYKEVVFVLDIFAKLKILDFSMRKVEA